MSAFSEKFKRRQLMPWEFRYPKAFEYYSNDSREVKYSPCHSLYMVDGTTYGSIEEIEDMYLAEMNSIEEA